MDIGLSNGMSHSLCHLLTNPSNFGIGSVRGYNDGLVSMSCCALDIGLVKFNFIAPDLYLESTLSEGESDNNP